MLSYSIVIKPSENIMSDKKTINLKNTKTLKEFIKKGGRKGALQDFNLVLRKAVGVKK